MRNIRFNRINCTNDGKSQALAWLRRAPACGGRVTVIASIKDPELIKRILAHRQGRGEEDPPASPLGARAPPQALPLLL